MTPKFAFFVPVGPSAEELRRTADLLESLFAYEPEVLAIILIDDSLESRDLSSRFNFPISCRVISILNPRRGLGPGHTGGCCVASLTAYNYINSHLDIDFVLKGDTDTLIVGPFSEQVYAAFQRNPTVGIVGSLGLTCNHNSPHFRDCTSARKKLDIGLKTIPDPGSLSTGDYEMGEVRLSDSLSLTIDQISSFAKIRKRIERALSLGYQLGEYIQGGGYAVNRELLLRLAGHLDEVLLWRDLPIGEDVMMGIYTHSVGMHLLSVTGRGEPFAIQFNGIPYSPEDILERRHSIIHSVKNDPIYTESDIRSYFKHRRSNY